MWTILAKYRVPDVLIRSLHENMLAGISLWGGGGGGDLVNIEVSNSWRQECVLESTLFILFFNVVIWCWHQRCAQL